MTVNLAFVLLLFARTVGVVKYLLGAKPALGSDSGSFRLSDCSGWVRWVLDRAGFSICDGSQGQWAWCEEQAQAGKLHKLVNYSDVQFAADDQSRLFIAFESDRLEGIGHVWLLCADGHGNMMTRECCGGHGVYSRPWQDLESICAACYELPVAQISPE